MALMMGQENIYMIVRNFAQDTTRCSWNMTTDSRRLHFAELEDPRINKE
jgi:hypothetical protein